MHAQAVSLTQVLLLSLALFAATFSQAWGQSTLKLKVSAGEPQWIWANDHTKDLVPRGVSYLRKTFELSNIEQGRVQITCDDRYDLYVNGRLVGSGTDWKNMQTFDVHKYLQNGRNVVAVRAENTSGATAGLVVRVIVKQKSGTEMSYSSDTTWKASVTEAAGWEKLNFNDSNWSSAQSYGEFGQAQPWGDKVAAADGAQATRFTIAPEFRVERVLGPIATKSLIAMTFNEFGEILASREGGPLLVISDADKDGAHEKVDVYCEQMTSCQGILALNGSVFAVGEGPEGTGMYRLTDEDRDHRAESVKLLFKFKQGMGEHGPHAPVLGPDGLIYLIIGNHSNCLVEPDANSPHHHWYEGDLVQPKYEDAGGHAVGIKAPGGVVLRTDIDGSFVQTFAGGFRNAYDIAFNRQGDLFTFDSDMEWDEGLPWLRPTRIHHVSAGAEFGWRSGWSVWPDYFYDSLPPTLNVGRGSPTGLIVYNHYKMPARYHNAMFACDWAQGRILAVKFKSSAGTYEATSEVFLEGRPLNVTDIEVGPDGWLYFCTGGRGTDGGIYRVVWTGKGPPRGPFTGAVAAIRQPQLDSAWSRQAIATIQQQLGDDWDKQLVGIAENVKNLPDDRARALDMMQLFGPFPTTELLAKLGKDRSPEVRGKATYLMGLHVDDISEAALITMLGDSDATVRRIACESVVRSGGNVPVAKLLPLLAEPNRYVSWAASRALQSLPLDEWREVILNSKNTRVFLVGAAALLAMDNDRATCLSVLDRTLPLMKGKIDDHDFIDSLRLAQIALHRGGLVAADVPDLCTQLELEYPSSDNTINRELLRLLAHLQVSEIIPRLLTELQGKAPLPDRLHAAMYARFIETGWNTDQKLALLEFYETSRPLPGGHSYGLYLDNFGRDFVAKFTDEEKKELLVQGHRAPGAALTVLITLPENPGEQVIGQLIDLDGRLQTMTTPAAATLRMGIVAILGRSRAPAAMAFLRERFEQEPNRRAEIAMGLAQDPSGENWPLLVRALPIVEGNFAREVLSQLIRADQKADRPEPIRQVILSGLRLKENGAQEAIKLLNKWTGDQPAEENATWDVALTAWQEWFEKQYPAQPPAVLPVEPEGNKWSFAELVTFLATPAGGGGDARRGAVVFEKAQCVKCHRYGTRGEGVGPDLTTVSQRFQKREIVESVISPSQVISDQYASKTIVTDGGQTFTGLVSEAGADAMFVLQANGEKIKVQRSEIVETVPSQKSAMPEGLFNTLSLDEIADLFAYMSAPPSKQGVTVEGGPAARKPRPK